MKSDLSLTIIVKFILIIILLYILLAKILVMITDYHGGTVLHQIPMDGHQIKDKIQPSNMSTKAPVKILQGNKNKKRESWKKKIALRKKNFGSLGKGSLSIKLSSIEF